MARRAERVARAGGSFLGGIANNPGIVILGLVLGGLFIFRDKISEAFASVGEGFGNIDIQLPEIKLPDITFPEFPKFPEITFPDFAGFFTGFQEQQTNFFEQFTNLFKSEGIPQPQKMVEDTGLIDPLTCECGSTIVQDAFGNVNQTCNKCAPSGTPSEPFRDAERFAMDFPEEFIEKPVVQPSVQVQPVLQLPTGFEGGGVSFVGGSIFPTGTGLSQENIANLSLSDIIDLFNVTASQASNIRGIAQGFTPEEESFLTPKVITPLGTIFDFTNQGFGGITGDPQFQGLTPEQIAIMLTGGNIQNF